MVSGQIADDFRIRSWEICSFHSVVVKLMGEFNDVQVSYMPRECNRRADHMAKMSLGSKPPMDLERVLVTVKERLFPSIQRCGLFTEHIPS